ncbi:MAG: Ig-like domain-containing protein [Planctomycetaceae bacterium]|jgi:hypothetical protein|nr:Ig-like domain-containing protein [Planctomycetaceae bacterium]
MKPLHALSRVITRRLLATALVAPVLAPVLVLGACSSVPKGAGVYLVTIVDARTGNPVEGVALEAAGAGTKARGVKPATATTDEDGEATLAFGNWGSVDLVLEAGEAQERWHVVQDRIAVNGGKSSQDPLRMIVGAGPQGGSSIYRLSITRVERGPKLDN